LYTNIQIYKYTNIQIYHFSSNMFSNHFKNESQLMEVAQKDVRDEAVRSNGSQQTYVDQPDCFGVTVDEKGHTEIADIDTCIERIKHLFGIPLPWNDTQVFRPLMRHIIECRAKDSTNLVLINTLLRVLAHVVGLMPDADRPDILLESLHNIDAPQPKGHLTRYADLVQYMQCVCPELLGTHIDNPILVKIVNAYIEELWLKGLQLVCARRDKVYAHLQDKSANLQKKLEDLQKLLRLRSRVFSLAKDLNVHPNVLVFDGMQGVGMYNITASYTKKPRDPRYLQIDPSKEIIWNTVPVYNRKLSEFLFKKRMDTKEITRPMSVLEIGHQINAMTSALQHHYQGETIGTFDSCYNTAALFWEQLSAEYNIRTFPWDHDIIIRNIEHDIMDVEEELARLDTRQKELSYVPPTDNLRQILDVLHIPCDGWLGQYADNECPDTVFLTEIKPHIVNFVVGYGYPHFVLNE